jgi:pyruvate kinase
MAKRARIGGTLGPACEDEKTLRRLVRNGLDVARLNFSHGELAEHRRRVARLRRVARGEGRTVALIADLQGPRFRVGRLAGGALDLVAGERVKVVAGRGSAAAGAIPVAYAALARDVKRGDPILLDDGKLALRVERVRGDTLHCAVERGGRLTDRKGINLPGTDLSVPALTPKDRGDLKAAIELGSDWLAVSFVRRAADLRAARRLARRAGRELPVMAKIERPEAVERLDEILAEADALLVARGDLGVELAPERVPILQKEIIEAAGRVGKPVMTATQMLDSMRDAPRPTRAEASDVANAVLDGSDCLLLTAETAAGSHPVEAVATMARIIEQAEASGRVREPSDPSEELSIQVSVCHAGCRAAHDVGARYLVVFTASGSTALQTARFRPDKPILAFSPDPAVVARLNVVWGVEPRRLSARKNVEALVRALDRLLLRESLASRGDVVVLLMGAPVGVTGTTNLIKVHRVGDT